MAREPATASLTGQPTEEITLGHLFSAYRRHRVPLLKPYRQRYTNTLIHMFTDAWGADLPVSDVDQSRVDVAHAAGWTDTRAMKVSYQQADPATVLRVVEHGS